MTFSSGVSSMSVQPAGALTGTPPMLVARAGRPFGSPGTASTGVRTRFDTPSTNRIATTEATAPTVTVRICRRRPRRSTSGGGPTGASICRARCSNVSRRSRSRSFIAHHLQVRRSWAVWRGAPEIRGRQVTSRPPRCSRGAPRFLAPRGLRNSEGRARPVDDPAASRARSTGRRASPTSGWTATALAVRCPSRRSHSRSNRMRRRPEMCRLTIARRRYTSNAVAARRWANRPTHRMKASCARS